MCMVCLKLIKLKLAAPNALEKRINTPRKAVAFIHFVSFCGEWGTLRLRVHIEDSKSSVRHTQTHRRRPSLASRTQRTFWELVIPLYKFSDELLMAHHAFLQFTNVDINMILDITQTKPQDNQTQMKHRRPSANDIVIHKATITCTQFHVFPIHGKYIQAKVRCQHG